MGNKYILPNSGINSQSEDILIEKLSITNGVLFNEVVSYDGDKYPILKIVSQIDTVGTSPTNLNLRINSQGATNEYGRGQHYGGRSSSGTNVSTGGYNNFTEIFLGGAGGTLNTGMSVFEMVVNNHGNGRTGVLQKSLTGSRVSTTSAYIMNEAWFWYNTSDSVTELQLFCDQNNVYGEVWIYGRS
jgi:hypothetical protein